MYNMHKPNAYRVIRFNYLILSVNYIILVIMI